MRKIMMIGALLLTVAAVAQTPYDIKGTTPEGVKTVYLYDVNARYAIIDSAQVSNGHFALAGQADTDEVLGVGNIKTGFALLMNDGQPVTADMANFTLKGSAQNEAINGYDRELYEMDRRAEQLELQAKANPSNKEALAKEAKALYDKRDERLMAIVNELINQKIVVPFLRDAVYEMNYEQLANLCQPSRPYANHKAMELPRRLMKNLEKRAPGIAFHDITLEDMNGQSHALSEWVGKGNYVMLDFWASWCGPCRREMPNVVANYAKYHAKGFQVIGISLDNKKEAWQGAVKQLGMEWPQLSDLKGWQAAAAALYGISSIPASVLISPEGKIVAIDLRGDKLGSTLEEIYK